MVTCFGLMMVNVATKIKKAIVVFDGNHKQFVYFVKYKCTFICII